MTGNRWIPDSDLERILGELHGRDRYVAILCIETGYRIDDIMCSRVTQWLPEVVIIRELKTGKYRIKELTTRATAALRDLIAETAAARERAGCDWLLPGLRNRPGDRGHEHRSTIWRHWRRAVRTCELPAAYTVHSLRKCYAVRLFRSKRGDLGAVQRDLNHDRPLTTWIYLADALIASSSLVPA